MTTILGTGQLGLAILEVLLADNPQQDILLVNRTGKLNQALPENVRLIAADVTNPEAMRTIAQKSKLLFSCTDVPYDQWAGFYPAVADALAYALGHSGSRLVFADNLYSYGNLQGAEISENLPHSATTKKGRIRASVLTTLLYSGKSINERVAVVKAADFVGPAIHKGLFGTDFLDRIYAGKKVALMGKIEMPHTFTYIGDFARAMVQVGHAPDAFNQTWHVPNAPALSVDKWLHLFEIISGKKIRKILLPKIVVRIGGLFNPFLGELVEMAYQFEYPYLVNHDKYIARFGNHFTYPSEIVKETIQWYTSTQNKRDEK